MIALKEFRYLDHEHGKSVVVHVGDEINAERLAANKVDLDKLERVKFVARAEAAPVLVATRKRGRPKKSA